MSWQRVVSITLFALLGVFAIPSASSSSSGAGTTREATDVPLRTAEGFVPNSIGRPVDGRYCIAGAVVDDDARKTAVVMMVDTRRPRLEWMTPIKPSPDYAGNTAIRCVTIGGDIYAVLQEHSHTQASLDQTRVVAVRLSSTGKLVKQRPLAVGFDEWSYQIDANATSVSIVGGTNSELDRSGHSSTFVAQFDRSLARTATLRQPQGAFWTGTQARVDGGYLLVGGQFMPNVNGSGGRAAFAVSKIDLVRDKYVWSSYPPPADARSSMAAFAPDGSSYVAAVGPAHLVISHIDPAGSLTDSYAIEKSMCRVSAVTINSSVFGILGAACEDPSLVVAVLIDVAKKGVVSTQPIGRGIKSPTFDGDGWAGIQQSETGGVAFRRGTLKGLR
ncbi:hypothetical protein [Paraburkholderia sp.]|uniref:hypothetical protein n=1 Tax=Paraburkholderia sp. TaxID=1926495 RepID=UPI00238B8569|nr:hypothetical protein [Paraburkholderia sp.]MDE1180309.1 hypothetical protein [Paraburkholderia sp.]